MKTSFKTITYLIILLLYFGITEDSFSQKLKTKYDHYIGDTVTEIQLPVITQGQVSTNHYKLILKRTHDGIFLYLKIKKGNYTDFEIVKDKPMEYILSSNDTLKIYPSDIYVKEDAYKDFGVTGLGSHIYYIISKDDLIKMRDNDLIWAKVYYNTSAEYTLMNTKYDKYGKYFRLKPVNRDKKRYNRKLNERITEFLSGI